MEGERNVAGEYRYSFNSLSRSLVGRMEKDDEIRGKGNSHDFGARMYDPRVGRFLSRDAFADQSPYVFASNKPTIARDFNGESTWVTVYDYEWNDKTLQYDVYTVVDRFLIDDNLDNARVEIHKDELAAIQEEGCDVGSIDNFAYEVRFWATTVYDLKGLSEWSEKYSTETGETSSCLILSFKTVTVGTTQKWYLHITVDESQTRLWAGNSSDLLFFPENSLGVIHTHPLNNTTDAATYPTRMPSGPGIDLDCESRYADNGVMDIIGYGKLLNFYEYSDDADPAYDYYEYGNSMREVMNTVVEEEGNSGTYENYKKNN